MRTGSVKKYVIPNIPYLFVLWACLKLGTAYRLAAGADFPHKLMGLGQTVGPAFADLAPGLDPFDWLVGIVGAVGFRLLIYFKSKNAKKFRRDEEFGSARWGGPKDIAPFVDPVFENNVILTGTELLTMNTRPKNPANARNLNACVIGSSGSGKTRFWLTPQLLQASAKKRAGAALWWSIQRAGFSPRWGLSCNGGVIGSRCSIPLTSQNPCTITPCRISATRPTF